VIDPRPSHGIVAFLLQRDRGDRQVEPEAASVQDEQGGALLVGRPGVATFAVGVVRRRNRNA
jgi:hypothetical protein